MKFKTYKDYLLESVGDNSLIENILSQIETTIEEMILSIESKLMNKNGIELTEYEKKMIRLDITFDLVKSIESYTEKTDELIFITANRSIKGNIEIKAKIKRDYAVYDYTTDVIYAGGYNIQTLHYRYLTKTNLPKTNNNSYTKIIDGERKRLTKSYKIHEEIKAYKERIVNIENKLNTNKTYSDNDILKLPYGNRDVGIIDAFFSIEYDDMDFDSHIKKEFTKEEWYAYKENVIKKHLKLWKSINIESLEDQIKTLKNSLNKLQIKLNALL